MAGASLRQHGGPPRRAGGSGSHAHLSRHHHERHLSARPKIAAAHWDSRASRLFQTMDSNSHQARMRSLQCRRAGAYLEAVPASRYLRLFHAEIFGGGQFRLGATGTNPNIQTATCLCGSHAQVSDIEHVMFCSRLSSSRSHRHDYQPSLMCPSHTSEPPHM